jgi:2-polyprenyl-3-methyl-5-hydroxy-6-metoxy-1,4-benzoquinol methylase
MIPQEPDSYKTTIETFDRVAVAYQEKFMHFELYNDTYNTFCELLPKAGAGILEVGCGPGNITRYLLSKRPDFKIKAIDLAPEMIVLAKRNNPTASFEIMDCRHIDKLSDQFDGIVAGFCMPYLSHEDCIKFIKDCSGLLSQDGILYFSTIEGDYRQSGYETASNGQGKAYVYYHEANYLSEELKKYNFELIELVRKRYPKGDTLSTHMIFIARRKCRLS